MRARPRFLLLAACRSTTAPALLAAVVACAPLLAAAPAAAGPHPSVVATDGWFDVAKIDPVTFSIHEPHYWQRNILYVLKGEERSLLIDSGSGTRDVAFIADKVTKKPMTVVASHLHYDHIGSHASFERVAMIDLPETRAHASATDGGNWYSPPVATSLWAFTGGFRVTEWWKPGDVIDLGGRKIEVVHLPGHTNDSIALVDRAKGYAFVGDHLYGGTLLANLPGSDLQAYLESTRRLLRDYPEVKVVFGAHEPGRLTRESLVALESALAGVLEHRVAGEPVWWLAWTSSRYPGNGFSILAP